MVITTVKWIYNIFLLTRNFYRFSDMFDTGRSTEMHEHTYMISTPKHAIHSPWLVRRQPQTVHEYYLNVHPSDQSTTDYNWCWGERQHSDSTPKTDSEWTLIYKGNSKETSHFMAKKNIFVDASPPPKPSKYPNTWLFHPWIVLCVLTLNMIFVGYLEGRQVS